VQILQTVERSIGRRGNQFSNDRAGLCVGKKQIDRELVALGENKSFVGHPD
jgi:hypothetical protein